jgi:hypothetical protein
MVAPTAATVIIRVTVTIVVIVLFPPRYSVVITVIEVVETMPAASKTVAMTIASPASVTHLQNMLPCK